MGDPAAVGVRQVTFEERIAIQLKKRAEVAIRNAIESALENIDEDEYTEEITEFMTEVVKEVMSQKGFKEQIRARVFQMIDMGHVADKLAQRIVSQITK